MHLKCYLLSICTSQIEIEETGNLYIPFSLELCSKAPLLLLFKTFNDYSSVIDLFFNVTKCLGRLKEHVALDHRTVLL